MPIPLPTIDELVATLKRSSLPTVLVEGRDDAVVYRYLETAVRSAGVQHIDVLPCGGRGTLLRLLARRSEFAQARLVFLADRDMSIFGAIHPSHPELVWTRGYSIENDLYDSSGIEKLLDSTEALAHRDVLRTLTRWFAFEIEESAAGREPLLHFRIREILDAGNSLSARFVAQRGWKPPRQELVDEIWKNYSLKLRGKQLLEAIVYFLSAPKRMSKFSYANVIELCAKLTTPHPHVARLVSESVRILATG